MADYRLDDYDYDLPPELIAQHPLEKRDRSRLMVVWRREGRLEHAVFQELPSFLARGDLLVLNNTRVIPARLEGIREGGGKAELLLLQREDAARWTVMVKPGKRLKPGAKIFFDGGVEARVEEYRGEGRRAVVFNRPVSEFLNQLGKVPLPPYIHEALPDPERYQTVYATEEGSAAAPTAGFHFTPAVFEELARRGVEKTYSTLHIGPGTFQPVKTPDIRRHQMHREYYRLPASAAAGINAARGRGRRVVAVGTTACRVLETAVGENGEVRPGEGWTELFIYPGYRFRVVDALLTNFHLPRSTLLMLVSAFAGRELVMTAYREAVAKAYRFYSFGDCMLIL